MRRVCALRRKIRSRRRPTKIRIPVAHGILGSEFDAGVAIVPQSVRVYHRVQIPCVSVEKRLYISSVQYEQYVLSLLQSEAYTEKVIRGAFIGTVSQFSPWSQRSIKNPKSCIISLFSLDRFCKQGRTHRRHTEMTTSKASTHHATANGHTTRKDKKDCDDLLASSSAAPFFSVSSLFFDQTAYARVHREFSLYHKHTLNVALHLFTTTLGVWGALHLVLLNSSLLSSFSDAAIPWGPVLVASYGLFVALTTPRSTAVLHSLLVLGLAVCPIPPWMNLTPLLQRVIDAAGLTTSSFPALSPFWTTLASDPSQQAALWAVVLGYGLQDLAHYLCVEPTYLGSYISTQPWMLMYHTIWLLPLVLDACTERLWFIPHLLVPHRRLFHVSTVARKDAVDTLRSWIKTNVPETPETTHLWPHQHVGTTDAVLALEQDSTILAAFRSIFPAHEYDVEPVQPMNEIYVTAVGSKSDINSDAVFYTPHVDGPYWWLPGVSLYRVLVAVTDNRVVRTRFNLQHETQDCVLDLYGVLGFDYNRELHWIDHVPGQSNVERRSLVKLHFVVYPKGWTRYGKWGSHLNSAYNTWARGNFLRTLRPSTAYEFVLAWWIWLTTWTNATLELHIGWTNLVYVAFAYALSRAFQAPIAFLVLTSFRHYGMYVATFANRSNVAHGVLMRDAKLYKTLSMLHLVQSLLPTVQWSSDVPLLTVATVGFALTLLATHRLGMVRTYFGTELGLVAPQYITAFPYGNGGIPHPMIVGQIFGFGVLLVGWWDRLTISQISLLLAHMGCYAAHLTQEVCTSSYK